MFYYWFGIGVQLFLAYFYSFVLLLKYSDFVLTSLMTKNNVCMFNNSFNTRGVYVASLYIKIPTISHACGVQGAAYTN